jgi:hypothetical protein
MLTMANEDTVTVTATGPDGTEQEFEITTGTVEDLGPDDQAFAGEAVEAMFDGDSSDQEVSYMDYDGDGKMDTAAADTDGDGQVDTTVADTDGDGKIDAAGKDLDGDGNLDVAVFDTDGDGQVDGMMADTDGDGEMDVADIDGDGVVDYTLEADKGLPTEEEISTNSIEFSVGEDGFPVSDDSVADGDNTYEATGLTGAMYETAPSDTGFVSSGDDPVYVATTDDASSTRSEMDTEQQAHSQAAQDAQAAADEFVQQGDYSAAAEARETAENEASAAGDSSMLDGSDSIDLSSAADSKETAAYYQEQQQEHIDSGDYEAAKQDAENAAWATGNADYSAGVGDHTGQADQDAYNLGQAVGQEHDSEYYAEQAESWAAYGNDDAAAHNAELAGVADENAGHYAAAADSDSVFYQHDASSDIASGGSYDAGYDMSSVDTGVVDTSYDAGTTSYDSGGDDTV